MCNNSFEQCQSCALDDIFQSHINIDLINMKCRNQLNISSKFNIVNEYVLCRYKWHRPIVLIGHSFEGLVSKNFVFILFFPLPLVKLLYEVEAASLRKKRVFEIWV
jgi:hypothetical protein